MSRLEQPISEEHMMLVAGYVLGDLSPEETSHFETIMGENPTLLAEVKALQVSFGLFPLGLTQFAPPPLLKEKLLTAYRSETAAEKQTVNEIDNTIRDTGQRNTGQRNTVETVRHAVPNDIVHDIVPIAPSSATQDAIHKPESVMLSRRSSIPWAKMIAGIAVLAALFLGADNLRLRQAIAQKYETDRVAAILQRPQSRLVALQGEGNAAAGTLLFTPGKWQEVVVSLGNLPSLPPDQVYRLWLTLNNGTVIPCGEFNTTATGAVFVTLRPVENPPPGTKASGIYVTLDRVNAPLNPTGQRILTGTL